MMKIDLYIIKILILSLYFLTCLHTYAQVIPEYKNIPQLSSAYEVLDRSMFPGVVTKEQADSIKATNNYFYNTYNYYKDGSYYYYDGKREYFGFLFNNVYGRRFLNSRIYVYKEFYPNDGLKRKKICSVDGLSIGNEYLYDEQGKLIRTIKHATINERTAADLIKNKKLKLYENPPIISPQHEYNYSLRNYYSIITRRSQCKFLKFDFFDFSYYYNSSLLSGDFLDYYYSLSLLSVDFDSTGMLKRLSGIVVEDCENGNIPVFFEIEFIHEDEFYIQKIFYLDGSLQRKAMKSKYGFYIGKEYVYTQRGELIRTIDHDKGYEYTPYQLLNDRMRWNANHVEIDKENSKWIVRFYSMYTKDKREYEVLEIDGKSGKQIAAYNHIIWTKEDDIVPDLLPNDCRFYKTLSVCDCLPTDEESLCPFSKVEKMPAYPGGTRELIKDIEENLVYPEDAKKEGLQGMVMVRFVVDKEGQICCSEITRSSSHVFDSAALEVLSHLKTFIPGEQHGEKVNVYYLLPIQFKLDK